MSALRASSVARALLAAATLSLFPASAHALATLTPATDPYDVVHNTSGDADGVLSPGDSFGLITRFAADEAFPGGNGTLSLGPTVAGSVTTATSALTEQNFLEVSNTPGDSWDPGTGAISTRPFQLTLNSQYQCGDTLPGILNIQGALSAWGPLTVNVPTGAPGALRGYVSETAGVPILEGTTSTSITKVPADVTNGRVRGAQITIDSLDYNFTAHWIRLELVAPSGKSVVLFDDQDDNIFPPKVGIDGGTAVHLTDLTFVGYGQGGTDITDKADLVSGGTFTSKQDLDALLAGEARSGDWTLRVTDVIPPGDARAFRPRGVGRAGTTGALAGAVGSWQLGVKGALCATGGPANYAAPEAWFGSAGPLVYSPGASVSLDADASTPAVSDDATNYPAPSLTYAWDTSGANGFTGPDQTGSTATLTGTRGKKTVDLRVTDSNGGQSTVSRDVIFSEQIDVTDLTAAPTDGSPFTPPFAPSAGQSTTFTANFTSTAGDATIAAVAWDLDGNGSYETNGTVVRGSTDNDASATAETTFTEAGVHAVYVRVTNDLGVSTTRTLVLQTGNTPPVADFSIVGAIAGSPNPVVPAGTNIQLDGSASRDTDGQITKYEWVQDFPGPYTSTDQTAAFTANFPDPGSAPQNYTVSLRVTDNLGGVTTLEKDVTVTARPVAVASASTLSPMIDEQVTLSATGSSDADGSVASYAWDLDNNGSFETPGPTATASFPNPGIIVAALRVTDNLGISSTVTNITLNVQSPVTGGGDGGGDGGGTGGGGGGGTGGTDNPTPPVTSDCLNAADPFADCAPQAGGTLPSGFTAQLAAVKKVKVAKVYAKGLNIGVKASAKGSMVVKAMIAKRYLKQLGLTSKSAYLQVGTGKVSFTGGGTAKVRIKFTKKLQPKLKKAVKVALVLRAVVTPEAGSQKLPLKYTVILLK